MLLDNYYVQPSCSPSRACFSETLMSTLISCACFTLSSRACFYSERSLPTAHGHQQLAPEHRRRPATRRGHPSPCDRSSFDLRP